MVGDVGDISSDFTLLHDLTESVRAAGNLTANDTVSIELTAGSVLIIFHVIIHPDATLIHLAMASALQEERVQQLRDAFNTTTSANAHLLSVHVIPPEPTVTVIPLAPPPSPPPYAPPAPPPIPAGGPSSASTAGGGTAAIGAAVGAVCGAALLLCIAFLVRRSYRGRRKLPFLLPVHGRVPGELLLARSEMVGFNGMPMAQSAKEEPSLLYEKSDPKIAAVSLGLDIQRVGKLCMLLKNWSSEAELTVAAAANKFTLQKLVYGRMEDTARGIEHFLCVSDEEVARAQHNRNRDLGPLRPPLVHGRRPSRKRGRATMWPYAMLCYARSLDSASAGWRRCAPSSRRAATLTRLSACATCSTRRPGPRTSFFRIRATHATAAPTAHSIA